MPRTEIDFTKYHEFQVKELAEQPGPTGRDARVFLDQGGVPLPNPEATEEVAS